ncbi:branched-chain amino acid ABC transporter permease [Rhizobiaceae bacterium n13]|uniref:Branched-chain amino acid ABC transporter permease n=1 Tax=Ferirhizobium litorale TaxID=2927786 RepID=A0AAE3QCV4_9HYPH|nr:branched-chain amino acid ABC transporter permease [Fererhizobium litorale]MDI7861068.1 branched-chain amino acid ABC transporter permease [Fererhizobium litorale]MDI7921215.1 branched-chain amino acid ABC transporter permease [Fererhizobium litorale]
MAYLLQQLLSAVPIAALYAALAFGYAIAFGVTRRPDITYGAFFVFAGQIYVLFVDVGWNRLWLVLPAALAFGAGVAIAYTASTGLFLGRAVVRPLVRASPHAVIVASLGVVIVLMEVGRMASGSRSLWLPPFLNEPIVFWVDGGFRVTLTVIQILNAVAMVALVTLGHRIITTSTWGRSWRAVCDDPLAAELCGANSGRVFVLAYGAAALIASICGVLATSYYGNMDFGSGMMFGLKVLMIAAVGGYGDPLRSAGGAASLGFAETLWGAYGPIAWRDLVIFSLLVFILVVSRRERPVP